MRLFSDLEIPLAPPRASIRASKLVGGDTASVGLHHNGVDGFVKPGARLAPAGKEAALLEFWDGQAEVAQLGREHPLALAVAVGGALVGPALIELSTDRTGDLSLQQLLEAPAHDLRDHCASGGALHEPAQLGYASMSKGHGLCSVWW
jgi:hypothetical protein